MTTTDVSGSSGKGSGETFPWASLAGINEHKSRLVVLSFQRDVNRAKMIHPEVTVDIRPVTLKRVRFNPQLTKGHLLGQKGASSTQGPRRLTRLVQPLIKGEHFLCPVRLLMTWGRCHWPSVRSGNDCRAWFQLRSAGGIVPAEIVHRGIFSG